MYKTFEEAIEHAKTLFTDDVVKAPRWQGVDISDKPEMAMHEVLFFSFQVPLAHEELDPYRQDIKPNLPWADDHFLERVCGQPLNPGKTWKTWPYAHSADRFRDEQGQFNHNYMERYWPKYAGFTPEGKITKAQSAASANGGIRYPYADLDDLLHHLYNDPMSRQAYFPIWFPEDGSHSDRKPCSLGHHFIMRDNKLHTVYYIRSCDYVRHFRDDIYLTVRLTLWLLNNLRQMGPAWYDVTPGTFTMHITSLHMFRNDYLRMKS